MIDALFAMNPAISLIVFIPVIILTGFIPYLLGYRLIGSWTGEQSKEIATILFRVIVVLLGLMLSMNYASVRSEYVKIQDSVELEAKELIELISDLDRIGDFDSNVLKDKLLEYVNTVIKEEWTALAKGSYDRKAEKLYIEIENGILNIHPSTPDEKILKDRLLKDIDEINDHRSARIYGGNVSLNWFIVVILIGFTISTFLLCHHPPKVPALIFISCYSAFIGFVLYSIISMNQPYHGITRVSVKPFQIFYNEFKSHTDGVEQYHEMKGVPERQENIQDPEKR